MEEEAIDNALPVSNHPMSVAAAAAMTQETLTAADKDKATPTGTFVPVPYLKSGYQPKKNCYYVKIGTKTETCCSRQ